MVMVMELYDEESEKVIAVLSEYFVLVLELPVWFYRWIPSVNIQIT
jgi:hypothetical protein